MKILMRAIAVLLLLGLLAAAVLVIDARQQLATPLALEEVERITIERGDRVRDVIDAMQAVDAFATPRQALYLRLRVRLDRGKARIKAGDFDLAPGTTPMQALALFVEGRAVLSELRLPEGWRFSQALDLVRIHPDLGHTLPEDLSPEELMARIGLPGEHPEGRFFPDTYRFTKGMRDTDFLRHAHALMAKTLAEEWSARAPELPYEQPAQALAMASIVEKETGAAFERPRIAGVFTRRLRVGMRLQTDPTVIYGLGESFDGNLRKIDLLTDGLYNSYTRSGLPPTPICLPSRAAIHAALHPEDDGSVYFVARGDGTHQFSKTLAEHAAAVRQYQLRR
ncbi:MAG: endolytic transglycosylase MltG [Stagnimonas sp.]|nr:endolytic transglycosylase MltG [Stagnimonas sp.]